MQARITPIIKTIHTHSDGVLEQMDIRTDKVLGAIEPRVMPPQLSRIEYALGLRGGGDGGWLTAEKLQAMELSRDEAGRIVLHRMDGKLKMRREWVFDPSLEYAMVGYCLRTGQPPVGVRAEIVASDFKAVDGKPLPFALTFRTIDPSGRQNHRWEATVTRYTLNGPDNTPDHYHVPWHKGMTVIDRRTGEIHRIEEDGQPLVKEIGPVPTQFPARQIGRAHV